MRHTTLGASLRLTGRGLLDALGGILGLQPLLVPLTGERGTVALISTPDALNGDRALNPGNQYSEWRPEVAARSALRISFYRPGRYAARVMCPLLVLAYEQDGVALSRPAVHAAQEAPRGELHLLPGGHYEPFLEGNEQAGRNPIGLSAIGICSTAPRRELDNASSEHREEGRSKSDLDDFPYGPKRHSFFRKGWFTPVPACGG
jgi:hypothetical protein